MKRLIKGLAFTLTGTLALLLVAAVAVYGASEMRFRRQFTLAHSPVPVRVTTDSAAVARGAHLATSFGGCVDCHGENLAGKAVIDDPAIGRVYGTNLTRGAGGVGGVLTDEQFERAIRHGVARDGSPLKVMPSVDYIGMSDDDLAAIIAYVRAAPPVDNVVPAVRVGPVGRALLVAGKLPMLTAERIDHSRQPANVRIGVTSEYGAYLASVGCKGCHNPSLSGGPIEGAPPSWVPAANLTPAGSLARWTEADFSRALRAGVRPDGTPLNATMPVKLTKNLTDDEIRALWLYLQTLQPMATGTRVIASR